MTLDDLALAACDAYAAATHAGAHTGNDWRLVARAVVLALADDVIDLVLWKRDTPAWAHAHGRLMSLMEEAGANVRRITPEERDALVAEARQKP